MRDMRNKNKEEIEKIEKILRSVKLPEVSNEEIEKCKEDFQSILGLEFSKIALQKERKRTLLFRLAYGLSIFLILFSIISIYYLRPLFIKIAIAKDIEEKLQYKVKIEDIITKNGTGIVIYDCEEIVVNVIKGTVEVFKPIEYEPTKEEIEKATEIIRNSKQAKNFIVREGKPPQDISNYNIEYIKGLLFPNSGKKFIEAILGYIIVENPSNKNQKTQIPLKPIKFVVDLEKEEVVYPKDP